MTGFVTFPLGIYSWKLCCYMSLGCFIKRSLSFDSHVLRRPS